MKTAKEYILEAQKNKKALGHFNVSNMEGVWAVSRAAKSLNLPVFIGVSEGERDFIGIKEIRAIVTAVKEDLDHPIFLNADHTYSFDRVKEVVDAGFDSVIIDGAKLSAEDNLKLTQESVQYAKSKNPNILIEGELGYIGQSSKLLNELPEGVNLDPKSLTHPDVAKDFVNKTGIDLLAPAVGNIHGMLKGGGNPALNIERVKEIGEAAGVPLVLHGGSGSSDEDFANAIEAGISIIHINTEIRVAYRDALKKSLQDEPDEISPYKIAKPAMVAMQKVIENRIKLFNRS
ncbi:MAG: tagatose-bisphosphate aldolase [Candidatus Zambryskibacteria bacterium CG_4_9_14_3_um_filter_40_16]|uniref:Tagatose-bisphosphate aldolase n=2 Tax=Candidatus Zambryskiibacteriota TaxID=1817925 RepID=A0A2H0K900_9BACT|nr:MAG: tagatose-bisphosphate aldolase [Candidatus Zambryskibacteria bacterium CG11_big_fil_rev_8_21_14_0_20_40_24]PJA33415.1 MAG: tagatose-bisphosphate aldolase [Candidatus Zambryskibacteria bacterium CG_4_9_14_3_um_filter_40_16]